MDGVEEVPVNQTYILEISFFFTAERKVLLFESRVMIDSQWKVTSPGWLDSDGWSWVDFIFIFT